MTAVLLRSGDGVGPPPLPPSLLVCQTGRQRRWRGGRLVPGRFSRWLTLFLHSAPMCGLQRLQPHAAAELLSSRLLSEIRD